MAGDRNKAGHLVKAQQTALSNHKAASQLTADRAGLVARGLADIAQSAFERAREYLDQANWDEAMPWLRIASERGHADAQFDLACNLMGNDIPEDDQEAFALFLKAAGQGHAKAHYFVGQAYDMGLGVAQNAEQAVEWYRRAVQQFRLAAEKGNAEAQYELGSLYQVGIGVSENLQETVKWWRLAAEQGYVYAQHNLGWIYAKGQVVPQDYKEAVKWYRLAAKQGYHWALIALGKMYAEGWGVAQSRVIAYALYISSDGIMSADRRAALAKSMSEAEIELAKNLSLEIVKPGNLLNALETYERGSIS